MSYFTVFTLSLYFKLYSKFSSPFSFTPSFYSSGKFPDELAFVTFENRLQFSFPHSTSKAPAGQCGIASEHKRRIHSVPLVVLVCNCKISTLFPHIHALTANYR